MRDWLIRLCIRLATWLDGQHTYVPTATDPAVKALATLLCLEQETRWPDRSGEGKCHAVYGALLKAFPALPKRTLRRAIEDSLP